MKIVNTPGNEQVEEMDKGYDVSRRRFFQLAGGIAGAGILLSACSRTPPSTFFVGSGDTGMMNYLNILEQVQAGFYIQLVKTPFYGMTASELSCFTDLRDQAIAHQAYWNALAGTSAIKAVVLNLSPVTFADQTSTLNNATILADLAVGAYNGSAQLFQNTDYILTAAKIATVQARRSAYVRDLNNYNSFADSTAVNSNGLDIPINPQNVMATLQGYIQTQFDANKLPTF
jgi:hypothetical protein